MFPGCVCGLGMRLRRVVILQQLGPLWNVYRRGEPGILSVSKTLIGKLEGSILDAVHPTIDSTLGV